MAQSVQTNDDVRCCLRLSTRLPLHPTISACWFQERWLSIDRDDRRMSGYSFLRLLTVAAAAVAASMVSTINATSESAATEPAQDDPVDLERDRKAGGGRFQSGGDQENGDPAKQAALLSEVDEVQKSKRDSTVRTWQQPRCTVPILLRMYTKERSSLDAKKGKPKNQNKHSGCL